MHRVCVWRPDDDDNSLIELYASAWFNSSSVSAHEMSTGWLEKTILLYKVNLCGILSDSCIYSQNADWSIVSARKFKCYFIFCSVRRLIRLPHRATCISGEYQSATIRRTSEYLLLCYGVLHDQDELAQGKTPPKLWPSQTIEDSTTMYPCTEHFHGFVYVLDRPPKNWSSTWPIVTGCILQWARLHQPVIVHDWSLINTRGCVEYGLDIDTSVRLPGTSRASHSRWTRWTIQGVHAHSACLGPSNQSIRILIAKYSKMQPDQSSSSCG